jgi:hypothetical protein
MGIACKINRNSNGTPVSVTTESGAKSKLFEEALELTKDPQSALEIYATIFTDEFQQEVLDPLKYKENRDLEERLKDSKVRNEKGELKKVFHGSRNGKNFDKIKVSPDSHQTDDGWLGSGAYFHPDKSVADIYAGTDLGNPEGRVFEAYLNLKNVFSFKGMSPYEMKQKHGGSKGLTDWLKSQGYDGATNGFEYIVFDEENIIQLPEESSNIDSNGEPKLSVVTKYIGSKNWEGKKLDFTQTRDLKKLFKAIPDLRKRISDAFLENGLFIIDRAKLKASGLYSIAEINGIMSNTALQDKIRKTVEGFMNTSDADLGVKYSIIGEKGASALDKVEGVTYRIKNLMSAKEMRLARKSAEEIKTATGWEFGHDGLWRYEVQDFIDPKFYMMGNREFFAEINHLRRTNGKVLIGDIINNKVSEAYADFKDLELVVIEGNGSVGGRYVASEGKIEVAIDFSGEDSPQSVINHEIQHAIQHREGFAKGGNMTMFAWIDGFKQLEYAIRLIQMKGSGIPLNKAIRMINNDYNLSVKSRSVAENVAKHLNPNMFEDLFSQVYEKYNGDAFENYERLYGEVEARNAQKRMDMDMDERRETLLTATEGISPEDILVFMHNYDKFTEENLGGSEKLVKKVIDRLKQNGLSKSVNVLNSLGITKVLKDLGINNKILQQIASGKKVTKTPAVKPGFNKGVARVQKEAAEYKKVKNIKDLEHPPVYELDTALSEEIAEAYTKMEHNPNDPKVKEAYEALMRDTNDQYEFIINKGIKVIRHEGEGEPYANSKEMLADLEKGQLKFLPNDVAFGEEGDSDKFSDNIALQASPFKLEDGYVMTNSEVFRVVHDYFGHGILGNQFGAIGEENATLQHAAMFSVEARPAMIAQTRGQNSWVNFSGVNDEAKALFKEARRLDKAGEKEKASKVREEAVKKFKFAEPKIGLLPDRYNFTKYETTRRIKEDREINELPEPRIADLPSALEAHTKRSSSSRGINRRDVQKSARIGVHDVNVIREFTLDEQIDSKLKEAFPKFQGVQKIYEITNGDVYRKIQVEALKDNDFRASVTVHSSEEYNDMRMFITEDGATGVTLTKDGFLGGAFSSKESNLPQLMVLGVKEGAITAEAFDTVLPNYYANFGFKAVSRTEFNDEYKPMIKNGALADWDYETYKKFNNGRPDVVFFIYDGGNRETIEERVGQFEMYNPYYKNEAKLYDKDSYDDAYRDMEVAAVKRGDYEVSKLEDKDSQELSGESPILKLKAAGIDVLPNGFVHEDSVYLNSDNMTMDTPIHEFGHLWNMWAKENLPDTYEKGIELIKQEGQKYIDYVKENQPTLEGEALYEEALAEAIGKSGELLAKESEGNSLSTWIRNLWEKIRDMMGISAYSADRISRMTLGEFTESVAVDLLKGKVIKRDFFASEKDPSKTDSIGMYESTNPHITEKRAIRELGGIRDQKELESKLEDSDLVDLRDKYFSDKRFAEDFFNEMKKYERVREFKVEGTQLTRRFETENKEMLEETFTPKDGVINERIAFLETLSPDLWRNNGEEVTEILKDIRIKAVDLGLNLKHLENLYFERSQDELINLLSSIKNANLQPNELRFNQLVRAYNKFFESERKASVRVLEVEKKLKGQPLVYVNTISKEVEMYNRHGLIEAGENLYMKVDNSMDNDTILHQLATVYMVQSDTLPFRIDPSIDTNNFEQVKEGIEDLVEDMAKEYQGSFIPSFDLKAMLMYKLTYGIDYKKGQEANEDREIIKWSNFNGDFNFLITDFIADFNKEAIKEDQKNSKVYEEFYSNFEIDSRGIVLKNTDPITMETIKDYLNSDLLPESIKENLKQYSIVSKESGLDVIEEAESVVKTTDFYRDFYVNNPKAAHKVVDVQFVAPNTIATRGALPRFINVGENLYEATKGAGDVTLYSRLPSPDSRFNKYNNPQPVLDPTVKLSEMSHLRRAPMSKLAVGSKLTRAEKEEISNRQFNCQ